MGEGERWQPLVLEVDSRKWFGPAFEKQNTYSTSERAVKKKGMGNRGS